MPPYCTDVLASMWHYQAQVDSLD